MKRVLRKGGIIELLATCLFTPLPAPRAQLVVSWWLYTTYSLKTYVPGRGIYKKESNSRPKSRAALTTRFGDLLCSAAIGTKNTLAIPKLL